MAAGIKCRIVIMIFGIYKRGCLGFGSHFADCKLKSERVAMCPFQFTSSWIAGFLAVGLGESDFERHEC